MDKKLWLLYEDMLKGDSYNMKIRWKQIYIIKEKIPSKLTIMINVIVNNYFVII